MYGSSGQAAAEDLADLIKSERLEEAAALAEANGDPAHASELLERAARFDDASRTALLAGEPARALRLAARGSDDARLREAALALPDDSREGAARDLQARRLYRAAAIVHDTRGDDRSAATAWELAGEPILAADRFGRAGDDREAARVLTTHLRARPDDGAATVALAKVLLQHGRPEAAAAILQKLADGGEHEEESRALLAKALAMLGLAGAKAALGEIASPSSVPPSRVDRSLLFGRYEVIRTVATTEAARVMEAMDRLSGRRVAVKLLRSGSSGVEGLDAIAHLERESQALERLHHPCIVPLHAYVPEGPALVCPWMEGGSLADVLLRGCLPPERAVEVACALLSALEEAHRVGILHRDVKPSNVLFDGGGAPYLADFGAAHVGEAATTVTVGLIGSLAYMAPEQRAGKAASVASDIYAVGVMLHESMCGRRSGATDDARARPSALFPELGEAHDRALLSLLAREPSARPESASAARARLESLSWRVTTPSPALEKLSDAPPASVHARLATLAGGGLFDTLLERKIRVIAANDQLLALARSFARIDHPCLAVVYRSDPATGSVWVEEPELPALADSGAALSSQLRTRLAKAVIALHEAGSAHGSIDRAHVHADEHHVLLAFPTGEPTAGNTLDDLAALDRL